MKNVLVLIHDDEGQEARFQAALDATRALNGHLTCLEVTAIVPVVGDAYGIVGGGMLIDIEREAEAANKARLRPRVEAEDVAWSWVETTDYIEPALEEAAPLADLIVVNQALAELPGPDLRSLASSLVLGTGKPILAVPNEPLGFRAAGAALVAWDGSREAAEALGHAVPLLDLAETVTLLEVGDGAPERPAEDAAADLSRHGIHAVIVRKPGPSAEKAILESARSGMFDYLVMGAYGHSRLQEVLFGGVTRRMLKECPLPILLMH